MKRELLKFNNEKWTLCEKKKNSMKKLFPKPGFQPPKKNFPKMFLTKFLFQELQ